MYELTYQFPNFIGATIAVWEWIGYFISRFVMDLITFVIHFVIKINPCW